jgi:hypothetical protein
VNIENCSLASMTMFHSDSVLCRGGGVGYGLVTPFPGEHGALVSLSGRANDVCRVFAPIDDSGDRSQICLSGLWLFFALFVPSRINHQCNQSTISCFQKSIEII